MDWVTEDFSEQLHKASKAITLSHHHQKQQTSNQKFSNKKTK
ncbi:hypothetical protein HMPREF9104_03171 [Lentilactobacillus kisonensis F0435]|uniref:Uncharacterized protein n=1 Tax=Lentilactobacillus kisonensis F0435 TaxID=797516 RepID=H1LKL7_9LACO|nr:hypothetical protein HMPREF9104_03171 [Lentilactobacillus kisonensis F0435]